MKDWQGELSARIKDMQHTISTNSRYVEDLKDKMQELPDKEDRTPQEKVEWDELRDKKDDVK